MAVRAARVEYTFLSHEGGKSQRCFRTVRAARVEYTALSHEGGKSQIYLWTVRAARVKDVLIRSMRTARVYL